MNPQKWEELLLAAREAREQAYAPYSKFQVGAALLGKNGQIYRGCNVENASYGLTSCAERTALFSSVVLGNREFLGMVLLTQSTPPSPPCGACLQALSEFCQDLPVLLVSTEGTQQETSLQDLLPHSFSSFQ